MLIGAEMLELQEFRPQIWKVLIHRVYCPWSFVCFKSLVVRLTLSAPAAATNPVQERIVLGCVGRLHRLRRLAVMCIESLPGAPVLAEDQTIGEQYFSQILPDIRGLV